MDSISHNCKRIGEIATNELYTHEARRNAADNFESMEGMSFILLQIWSSVYSLVFTI